MNAIQLTQEIFLTYDDAIEKYGTDRIEIAHFKSLSLNVKKPCCNLKEDMVVQQPIPSVSPISFFVEFRLRQFYGKDNSTYWRYVREYLS